MSSTFQWQQGPAKEKAAVLKFWRGRGKYSNVENVLYYDGKRVNLILLFRLDI